MKKIYLKVDAIRTDPIQYKPYAPTLTGENLYVAVPLPADCFDRISADLCTPSPSAMILTPAGLAELMGKIAMAIRNRLTNG